jgi:uncharacterized integral membrane protein
MVSQADDEEGPPPENSSGASFSSDDVVPTNEAPEPITSTRTSRAWIRILPAIVVLAVILIFVFQNPKDVKVRFFTSSGTLPLSVALLGSVALGALLVLALGSMRILQLRRQVREKASATLDDQP